MGCFRFWLLPPEKLISQTLLGLGWLLVRPRLWRLLGRLMATAGLPDGIPVSLSLDTHSIWQETFQETFIEGQRDSTPIRLLRPVHFASVLPPAVVGLWSVIYRTQECRLVVIFRFPVLRQKRGCYTQRPNFFFQPRHLKLFLSQNFVNVLHASPFHGQNNGSEYQVFDIANQISARGSATCSRSPSC